MFNLDTINTALNPTTIGLANGLIAANSVRKVYDGDRDVEIALDAIVDWNKKYAKVKFRYKNTKSKRH